LKLRSILFLYTTWVINHKAKCTPLSNQPLELKDDIIPNLLMQYFLKPFEKANEVYHLMHSSDDLALNELHNFATKVFEDKEKFQEMSEQIAKHLYKVSTHPNIKGRRTIRGLL
jgi:hypothetical protein